MLDQNTDRMWFVIGAVIVGAAIIFIANGSLPTLFASVSDLFEGAAEQGTQVVSNIAHPDGILSKEDGSLTPNPNLLPNSGGSALHNVSRYYASDVVEEDGKMAIAYKNNGNIVQFYTQNVSLVEGQEYTFSFYAKGSRPMTLDNFIYINTLNRITTSNGRAVQGSPISTEWERYSVTFVAQGSGAVHPHMYPKKLNADGTSDIFYLTEWKLEKGSVMTPWVL